MQLIFIAGAWGSGTTALTGALDALGLPTFGPHVALRDPHTPNSFELAPFRDLVLTYVDETRGCIRPTRAARIVPALQAFALDLSAGKYGPWPDDANRRALIKVPAASLLLPQLAEVFNLTVVMVQRPLAQIEASRKRRDWPAHFGAEGAARLYEHAFADLREAGLSCLTVSHRDLTGDPEATLTRVIAYCGLEDLAANLGNAAAFIRPPADRSDPAAPPSA